MTIIVHVCDKFDQYILEKDVIKVEMDHKPLIATYFQKVAAQCTQATAKNAPASAKVPFKCNIPSR